MSKPGVAVGAQQGHHQRLDGRMRGAVGVRVMQVSMMSTPASMAFRWLMGDMPEVKWLCR
jgi:hypothetical protein